MKKYRQNISHLIISILLSLSIIFFIFWYSPLQRLKRNFNVLKNEIVSANDIIERILVLERERSILEHEELMKFELNMNKIKNNKTLNDPYKSYNLLALDKKRNKILVEIKYLNDQSAIIKNHLEKIDPSKLPDIYLTIYKDTKELTGFIYFFSENYTQALNHNDVYTSNLKKIILERSLYIPRIQRYFMQASSFLSFYRNNYKNIMHIFKKKYFAKKELINDRSNYKTEKYKLTDKITNNGLSIIASLESDFDLDASKEIIFLLQDRQNNDFVKLFKFNNGSFELNYMSENLSILKSKNAFFFNKIYKDKGIYPVYDSLYPKINIVTKPNRSAVITIEFNGKNFSRI